MLTTNAQPVSTRPSEPNYSKSSQINRPSAKLIICYDTNKCPQGSKRPYMLWQQQMRRSFLSVPNPQ